MHPFKTGLSKFKKRTPGIKAAIEEAKYHITKMMGPQKVQKRKYVRKDPVQKAMDQARRMNKGQLSSAKQQLIEDRQMRIMRRLGLIPPPPELFD